MSWPKNLLSVLLLAVLAPVLAADEPAPDEGATPELAPRFQTWLEDVALLISDEERDAFLGLGQDYQREHFIRRFWKVRDPFPRTGVNELRVVWEKRVAAAREEFESLDGKAAQMMLLLGVPTRRERLLCSQMMSALDVWIYEEGSDRIAGYFTLVFIGNGAAQRLWEPSDGLRGLVRSGGSAASSRSRSGVGMSDQRLARVIVQECVRGDDILSALSQALPFSEVEKNVVPPRPGREWVEAFLSRSTDADEDAPPLAAELDLSFPGRHQSRTVVQGLLAVDRDPATDEDKTGDDARGARPTEGGRFYNLVLDGEVLRKGELFDTFRYHFDFAAATAPEQLPVVIQRYLRPGEYRLILKVEDLGSKRVFRREMDLQVPVFDPTKHRPAPESAAASATRPASTVTVRTAAVVNRLAEANATISTGDHTIELLALPDTLVTGKLRVAARVRGEGIAKVAFELNGVEKLRKTRPPYSVELDLGTKPRFHTLRAYALGEDGEVLARDEVIVNGGPHRFSIRLLSPQPGQTYTASVRAHAEVEVPESERLERVEIYLNEERQATLYQPPFEHPVLLTPEATGGVAYVRAVATLRSGVQDEDVVFINAPDFVDATKVHFVELYTTVLSKGGDFVEDLRQEEVTVLEDGKEQTVRRFEKVRDLPINAGLVLDTSTSMLHVLHDVRKAAHRFLETVLTDRDRAALITFNDAPTLQVRFTSDTEVLAGGLAGLTAEGETALYDTIIYSLHYFSGMRGKRAIVVLTDGEDSSSRYSYEDTLEFARQTGVAIYIIGLGLPSEPKVRSLVRRLAVETGGEAFFIDRVAQLARVYDSIQLELRSQYLVGYQSSQYGAQGSGGDFREVEVRIDRKGVEAKTIRGYYP